MLVDGKNNVENWWFLENVILDPPKAPSLVRPSDVMA
jgi:hypothetical protein